MSKFAKKGHLVVDVDNAKLHKVGDENPKTKKFLKSAGIEEAPEPKATKSKKEKPAKEAKAPKEKKEAAEKGPDNRKLKLVQKENPKREGSSAHERYELYRNAKTVQAFIDAGGSAADIKYDESKGYIEVA